LELKFKGLRIRDESLKPLEVVVEITTHCNYSCIHCFRNLMKPSEHGFMDLDLYRKLLNQLEEINVKKLTFTGWGEPLVHPHVLDFLSEAKKRGFHILLNTNGSLLAEYAEDIAKIGVDGVVVSIDSADPDLYEKIRVGGAFDSVLSGVLKLVEVSEKLGKTPLVAFWFTAATYNCHEIPNLPLFARRFRAVKVSISHFIPLSSRHEEMYSCVFNAERLSRFRSMVDKLSIEAFKHPVKVLLPPATLSMDRACPFAEARATYVRFDGGVSPCIHYAHSWRFSLKGVERRVEPVVFGNISAKSILEIWRSEQYSKFRIRATLALMPSCLSCELAPYCSYTQSNESDCWGNTPTCAHCPYLHGYSRCPLQHYLFEKPILKAY